MSDIQRQTEALLNKLQDIAERYPLEVVPFIMISQLISAARSINISRSTVRTVLRQAMQGVPTPRSATDVAGWPKYLKDPKDVQAFECYATMLDADVSRLWPEEMAGVDVVLNALVSSILNLVLAGVRKEYILKTFDEEWEHSSPGETISIDPARRQRRTGGDLNGLS